MFLNLHMLSQKHAFSEFLLYDCMTHSYKWVGPPRNTHGQLTTDTQTQLEC